LAVSCLIDSPLNFSSKITKPCPRHNYRAINLLFYEKGQLLASADFEALEAVFPNGSTAESKSASQIWCQCLPVLSAKTVAKEPVVRETLKPALVQIVSKRGAMQLVSGI